MKNIYFMLLSAMLLVLVGCNKEKIDNGPVVSEETDDYVYMDMALQLPAATGTRSSSDWKSEDDPEAGEGNSNSNATPDTEEGLDYENTVKTALIVLASTDGSFISYSEVSSGIAKTAEGEYQIKAKFKRGDIDDAYDKEKGGPLVSSNKVNIYVYANYSDNLHQVFSKVAAGTKDWLNEIGTIEENPSKAGSTPVISNNIWAKHSFLMTNATEYSAKFPDSSDAWDAYSDSAKPYDVAENSDGVIKVERAAARIDFKDASKDAEGNPNNNTYNIVGGLTSSGGDDRINLVDVQLTRMSLVNMSKKFYYLRRVATDYTDYTNNNGGRIGKYETASNFVVDTDWADKYKTKGINPENASEYFNFPLYGERHVENGVDHYAYNRGDWYTDNINDILGTSEDSDPAVSDNYDGDYKIWRYVTENTMPDVESQKTVQSTGIIFKGLILPGRDINKHVNGSDQYDDESPRYISEAVEKALNASKAHLPKFGDGDNESKNTKWDGTGDLTENSKNDLSYEYPVLYEFDGLLFAGSDEVVLHAANEGEGSLMYAAVQHVLDYWILDDTNKKFVYNDGKVAPEEKRLTIRIYNEIRNGVKHVDDGSDDYTTGYSIEFDESSVKFKALATSYNSPDASNFTIYEASFEDTAQEKGEGWGYYCYYFYWNRHNDNGLNGKMGPMEFAIVRNNVYKLSVTTINRLGHPRNPDNDPDPFDPEQPDEDPRVYLTVDLKVLPWVVRVNNIEF